MITDAISQHESYSPTDGEDNRQPRTRPATLREQTGEIYGKQRLHKPVLSRAVANDGKDSIPRHALSMECAWFIATRNCWKSLGAMIYVRAGQRANLRTAAFGGGLFDGARRDHFFQRLATTTLRGRLSPL